MREWEKLEGDWIKRTSLPSDLSKWAIETISQKAQDLHDLDEVSQDKEHVATERESNNEALKVLKKNIKNAFTARENALDDLSLNAPNSYKLQISIPSNLNYLMKAWAAAEGRDLSSVALQCLETGLREMKGKGSIPAAALRRYDNACEKRIALAEVNHLWEAYENLHSKGGP